MRHQLPIEARVGIDGNARTRCDGEGYIAEAEPNESRYKVRNVLVELGVRDWLGRGQGETEVRVDIE